MMRLAGVPYTLLTRDWMMHERARCLTDWVSRLPRDLRILDAGCGSGLCFLYLERRYAPKVAYYAGIDLDTRRLRERYRGATISHDFIDADLDSPWRLEKFDLIFASEVIEHIAEDRRLFKRLCEHLSDRGVLVITTPNKPFVQATAEVLPGFDAISASQDGGHVRVGYDPDDLIGLARENSLITISKSYLGRITMRELRKRDALRDHSDFANTARFNLPWLIRRALQKTPGDFAGGGQLREDRYWSLAMAFQKNPAASIGERDVAAERRQSA
jgi:SAM-dependent methyltransferase